MPADSYLFRKHNVTACVVKVDRDLLQLHANEGLVYDDDIPFTGVSVDYYDNGIVKEEISFMDGKR
ncbi:MAG: antitoxin component YwqK of YwqJK toxin-antitoxin module, partial [Cyclobacteriaceae bacterium]